MHFNPYRSDFEVNIFDSFVATIEDLFEDNEELPIVAILASVRVCRFRGQLLNIFYILIILYVIDVIN